MQTWSNNDHPNCCVNCTSPIHFPDNELVDQLNVQSILNSIYKLDYISILTFSSLSTITTTTTPTIPSQNKTKNHVNLKLCAVCLYLLNNLEKSFQDFNRLRQFDSYLGLEISKLNSIIEQFQFPDVNSIKAELVDSFDDLEDESLPPLQIHKESLVVKSDPSPVSSSPKKKVRNRPRTRSTGKGTESSTPKKLTSSHPLELSEFNRGPWIILHRLKSSEIPSKDVLEIKNELDVNKIKHDLDLYDDAVVSPSSSSPIVEMIEGNNHDINRDRVKPQDVVAAKENSTSPAKPKAEKGEKSPTNQKSKVLKKPLSMAPADGTIKVCVLCQKHVQSADKLNDHYQAEHFPLNEICPICQREFSGRFSIKNHLKSHAGFRVFECEPCRKVYGRKNHLTDHFLSSHSVMSKHVCQVCSKGYEKISELNRHMKTHKVHKCHCGKAFKMPYSLKIHKKIHEKGTMKRTRQNSNILNGHLKNPKRKRVASTEMEDDDPHDPSFDPDDYLDDAQDSQVPRSPSKRLKKAPSKDSKGSGSSISLRTCVICKKKLKSPQLLVRHLQNEHMPSLSSQSCLICSKKCPDRFSLKNHLQGHAGQPNYKCSNCDRTFGRRRHYKNHIKYSHIKLQVKFKCPFCSQSFRSYQARSQHLKSHQVHFCYCGKSFASLHQLRIHLKFHKKFKKNPSISKLFLKHWKQIGFNLKKARKSFNQDKLKIIGHCSVQLKNGPSSKRKSRGQAKKFDSIPKGTCPLCKEGCSNPQNLSNHLQTYHIPIDKVCPICNQKYPSHNSMKNHLRSHAGLKTFECDVCQKTYTRIKLYDDHCENNHSKQIKCPVCFQICESRTARSDHMKIHRLYECHCGLQFKTPKEWRIHTRSHKETKKRCVKKHRCKNCRKTFGLLEQLSKHLEGCTIKLRPFSCDQCSQHFSCKANLKQHQLIHAGIKDFLCAHCGKAFVQPGDLTKHLRIHTGEKPYSCHLCPKKFRQKVTLNQHLISSRHADEKRFLCPICGLALTQSHSLQRHMQIHTGELPFKCTKCDAAFPDRRPLTKHLLTHDNTNNSSSD